MLPALTVGFPQMSVPQSKFTLSEGAAVGTPLVTVSGHTSRLQVSLTYFMAGGNLGQAFDVSPAGQVYLVNKVDYEQTHQYQLWIGVSHKRKQTVHQKVVIV